MGETDGYFADSPSGANLVRKGFHLTKRKLMEERIRNDLPENLCRTVNNSPKISIVTPSYNTVEFLESSLISVLQQEYPNLDYVVVDGDSTDGSQRVLEQYRDQFSYYVSEADDGHADALNKGFEKTSGEIMGWLNSDDLLMPGALNLIGEIFAKFPEVHWITGHPSAMYEDGIWRLKQRRNWSRLRFLNGDYRWIQQESTFWRRSLWDRAGGRLSTDLKLAVDLELWVRFFRYSELYPIDAPLGVFRYREGQRSIVHKELYEAEALDVVSRELATLDAEYRAAFRQALPESVVPIDHPILPEKDFAISICDPPLIRLEDVSRRSETNSMKPT